jgi:ethanolamine ammonia-lyase small subunit
MSAPEQPGDAITPGSGQAFDLRTLTSARVGLVRTGVSVATRHALEFSLAHAQARDAVHFALDVASLTAALEERGLPWIAVHSAAADRTEYLRRPDLGRGLSLASSGLLAASHTPSAGRAQGLSVEWDREQAQRAEEGVERHVASTIVTVILADGLSALAVQRHALPVIDALLPLLKLREDASAEDRANSEEGRWGLTPIVIAEQARVALGDQIGAALQAEITVTLIGERPGLSSPDSLGAYITWAPCPGRTDAERNCVSNIRPPLPTQLSVQSGLDYATAAGKAAWYMKEARRLGLTGVALREPDLGGGGQRALHDPAEPCTIRPA